MTILETRAYGQGEFPRPAQGGGSKLAAAVSSVAHFLVLLFNAVARQIVQVNELGTWAALEKIPVRGEWGSFALFAVTLAVVLIVMAWTARVTRRALRPRA